MTSPLDEFVNSPRRFRNDDGSEVASSSLVKLGPGLVASRPVGGPGETTFAQLDTVTDAESIQADINTINDRITTVEQGGRWATSVAHQSGATEDVDLELGRFHRFDISAYGGGEFLTCTLPAVTADDVGRRVGVSEISGIVVGDAGVDLRITTTGAQTIDGRTLPIELAGVRPKIVLVAVVIVTDTTYGWTVESWGADP